MTRISIRTANPRDLLSFKNSLKLLPFIKNLINEFDCKIFKSMYESFDPLEDIYEILEESIDEDAPITIKEGGIFKPGYSAAIDEFKMIRKNAKDLLAALEDKEREATGIKNLKVKYIDIGGGIPTNYCSKEDFERFIKGNNKKMYFKEHFISDYYPYYSDIADSDALDYILKNTYLFSSSQSSF